MQHFRAKPYRPTPRKVQFGVRVGREPGDAISEWTEHDPVVRLPAGGVSILKQLRLSREVGVRRILFVGSSGGEVPHTREPRLYVTCSDKELLPEMQQYGVGRTGYEGPGSFTSYLMTQAPSAQLEMVSLVTEIPSYLQGTNPSCIEAVTRRLAKILKLPVDLDSLRAASTRWELAVSNQLEKDDELATLVRKLEQAYDDSLLEQDTSQG